MYRKNIKNQKTRRRHNTWRAKEAEKNKNDD